jgi:hypothetical protein
MKNMPHIHSGFDAWMRAASRNELTGDQWLHLERHLATCPTCMAACESDATMNCINEELAVQSWVFTNLEDRISARVDKSLDRVALRRCLSRSQLTRMVMVTVIGTLLLVRGVNLDLVTNAAETLSTTWRTLLTTPQYSEIMPTPTLPAKYHLPLAATHKIAAMLVETVMWGVMLTAVALIFLDAYRRRILMGFR